MNRGLGNYSDAIALPKLIKLGPNLIGAAFSLMKLVPARYILHKATETGQLEAGGKIVETTSGTFGLALAIESALHGWDLTLVSDPVIDAQFASRLAGMGARLDIVTEPAPGGGYQQPRIDRVEELLKEYPEAFCPQQYTNPDNPRSYAVVAEHLVDSLGAVDTLIGPVGSGGSMSGTARFLRQVNSDMLAVGVDTHHSVIFGQPDGPRALRGLGNSLMPANVDHSTFDEVHWISNGHAAHATRGLHRSHAAFMGPTSGAAYFVAAWHARAHPDRLHVVMLPDEGHRYHATVYDDEWFAANAEAPPDEPRTVGSPLEGLRDWCRFEWNRRPSPAELTAVGAAQ
ncbi:pyridoxal-phosphate dependent enzyme [Glycomyces xiaoerkulensis]|uniref:pyridoxal-phosphate dependent enzyme n=1 Tax=Glycomyces xiaoerkulensis TaxID=2038139 RepID=UPI000C25F2D0|nr:pyridoxal-phosphate dependent enzyme [Glycomyces xiaoerkulensis]